MAVSLRRIFLVTLLSLKQVTGGRMVEPYRRKKRAKERGVMLSLNLKSWLNIVGICAHLCTCSRRVS